MRKSNSSAMIWNQYVGNRQGPVVVNARGEAPWLERLLVHCHLGMTGSLTLSGQGITPDVGGVERRDRFPGF